MVFNVNNKIATKLKNFFYYAYKKSYQCVKSVFFILL